MVYRPELDDETKELIEKSKEPLRKREEDDLKTKNEPWRRDNETFDVNWIIREALKSFLNDWEK